MTAPSRARPRTFRGCTPPSGPSTNASLLDGLDKALGEEVRGLAMFCEIAETIDCLNTCSIIY